MSLYALPPNPPASSWPELATEALSRPPQADRQIATPRPFLPPCQPPSSSPERIACMPLPHRSWVLTLPWASCLSACLSAWLTDGLTDWLWAEVSGKVKAVGCCGAVWRGAPFCLSGVWRLLSASWILWPGGGFVTVSVSTEKTYGIHNWHDRVSFCLPCVILTLTLYSRTL